MDNQEYIKVSKEIKNYKIARTNVLLFLAITVVNFITMLTIGVYWLFSIYTCLSFAAAAKVVGGALFPVYIILGLIVFAAFLTMWLLSKKHGWAMIVLLVLFGLDCVLLFVDTINAIRIKEYGMLLDMGIHIFMMYYLILGVKSATELKRHFPQGVKLTGAQLDEAYRLENGIDPRSGMPVNGAAPAPAPYAAYASGTAAAAPMAPLAPPRPNSPVIEEDKSKNRPAVQATYNNAPICVKLTLGNKASLIIGGKVYGREKLGGMFSANTRISAVVNGVEYTYEYQYKYPHIDHILYADGKIIAHRTNY